MNNFQCKYIPNIAVKVSTIKKKIVLIVFWNSNFSGYPMFSLLTLSCLYPIPKRSSSLPIFSSVQFSSVAQSCPTLCNPIDCSMPGLPVHHQLLEFTQTHTIESVMPSNHLILCHPLILSPSIFPSIKVFSNESALPIKWPKYWSFSFSIRPSNEYSGLISFKMDWLDLLAVQGTLKRRLQHHSSKTSVLLKVLSFLYSPTLTSIHDYWKNHSFD